MNANANIGSLLAARKIPDKTLYKALETAVMHEQVEQLDTLAAHFKKRFQKDNLHPDQLNDRGSHLLNQSDTGDTLFGKALERMAQERPDPRIMVTLLDLGVTPPASVKSAAQGMEEDENGIDTITWMRRNKIPEKQVRKAAALLGIPYEEGAPERPKPQPLPETPPPERKPVFEEAQGPSLNPEQEWQQVTYAYGNRHRKGGPGSFESAHTLRQPMSGSSERHESSLPRIAAKPSWSNSVPSAGRTPDASPEGSNLAREKKKQRPDTSAWERE